MYFDGHFRGAKDPISITLAFMAHLAKERVVLQIAFWWLHINNND
jgi:hypothetical protein